MRLVSFGGASDKRFPLGLTHTPPSLATSLPMPEHDHSRPSHQWWRWFALPIAAVAGGIVGAVAVGLAVWFVTGGTIGAPNAGGLLQFVPIVLRASVFGWLFVYIASVVAPTAKLLASTVMTGVLIITSGAALLLVWGFRMYDTSNAVINTVEAVIAAAAGLVALVQLRRTRRSEA